MEAGTLSGISERTGALRDRMLRMNPTICTERARFYTEIYKQHEDEPVIVRRALALDRTLRSMSVFIEDGELIVGNQSSRHRAAPIFPEYAVDWLPEEMDGLDKRPGDAFYIPEDQKTELLEIASWWKGRVLYDKGRSLMSQEIRDLQDAAIIKATGNLTSGDAHIAVDFQKILDCGLRAYVDEVSFYSSKLDRTKPEDLKKASFYRSVEISIRAFIAFIERYADLAGKLAASEKDPMRAGELTAISGNCRHISQNAPLTFYQALQLTWFVQLVLQIESNGHSVSLGRMDQYLYPFYKKDIISGALTEEFASELLENTWIKLLSVNKIRPWSHTRFSAGGPLYQNVTIGGQTAGGEDAVNELSFIILRSVGKMRLTQPNLSVRFHRNMSESFMQECIEVIALGFGMPAFNNDEIVIPGLLKLGVEKEDAYNYSAIGALKLQCPGNGVTGALV